MNYERTRRIGEEIKKVISSMLTEGKIKDPHISDTYSLISITKVDVVRDLKYAYIYVSVLGKDEDKIITGFEHASAFIRKEVGRAVKLRYTPELIFRLDNSIEEAMEMSKLIDKVKEHDDKTHVDTEE